MSCSEPPSLPANAHSNLYHMPDQILANRPPLFLLHTGGTAAQERIDIYFSVPHSFDHSFVLADLRLFSLFFH